MFRDKINLILYQTYLYIKSIKLKNKIIISLLLLILLSYFFLIPTDLFKDPVCSVITDKDGELLGAHVASDGQYRFPASDSIPDKFTTCITTFEDKRFFYHWGFDVIAFARAVKQNLSSKKIMSGGSTLTMQVVRLSRKGKDRTFFEKIIEIIIATRIEFSYSKNEILSLYSSYAPFGGNIVGLETASWRYFGISSKKLTWAESATLAVLPNSPALIHPGRNRTSLLEKRNRLLKKLFANSIIDSTTYELAIDEPIPESPKQFPDIAGHLLFRSAKELKPGSMIKTNIDSKIQLQANSIIEKHSRELNGNGINNIAVLVMEVKTGKVRVYIGNSTRDGKDGTDVDIITSYRSTGSILKPFLFAGMLTSGEILPSSLVFDIPTQYGGFSPKNYNRNFSGAVPAREALARSLNVPAVRMLKIYGVERFHHKLQQIGLSSLNRPASHYGLSLILGGCEGSLWDICGIYASMARTLENYHISAHGYNKKDFHSPLIYFDENKEIPLDEYTDNNSYFDASAIYLTFNAMLEVERPGDENYWRTFESSEKVAWKTGTSFGFRDAWAIGITPDYVVGVWVGNADGEGRPGLVGVKVAAPVLFDIFNILPDSKAWFKQPVSDMTKVNICKQSGYIATDICPDTDSVYIPHAGTRYEVCPFHKLVHTDNTGKYRVNTDCESIENIVNIPWFVLPPSVEYYYKGKHSEYRYLPPYRSDCNTISDNEENNIELIYPYENSRIYIPVEIDGTKGKTVFEATLRRKYSKLFWYLDSELIATTKENHQLELSPEKGKHILIIIDEQGSKLVRNFEIISDK